MPVNEIHFSDTQKEKPGEMWQVQESLLLRCEMPGRKWILVGSEVDKTMDKSCKQIYCPCACAQKADWAMHKLECSAMNVFGEKWCPSEITRLVARILTKKVSVWPQTSSDYRLLTLRGAFVHGARFPQKMQKDRCASEKLLLIEEVQSRE